MCTQYNIDITINKKVTSRISIQELQSKIAFLEDNNMKVVNEEGLLYEIFSMSSQNMNEKYNISLEELINKYYINKQKGKGA